MAAERSGRSKGGKAQTPTGQEPGHAVRLQKILAAAGFASRRGAEELIRAGRVTVNGKQAGLGDKADPLRDEIAFDGERIRQERPLYWVVNKPNGLVTTVRDPHGRPTVMQLLPDGIGRIHPVGRLDRDSCGLLLMTNDGDLTQRLLHPSHSSEKEYRVVVKGQVETRPLSACVGVCDWRTGPPLP